MSDSNKTVKFSCIYEYCRLLYSVPFSQKDLPSHYKCPMCGKKSVRLVDTNVYQIHPKKRRF